MAGTLHDVHDHDLGRARERDVHGQQYRPVGGAGHHLGGHHDGLLCHLRGRRGRQPPRPPHTQGRHVENAHPGRYGHASGPQPCMRKDDQHGPAHPVQLFHGHAQDDAHRRVYRAHHAAAQPRARAQRILFLLFPRRLRRRPRVDEPDGVAGQQLPLAVHLLFHHRPAAGHDGLRARFRSTKSTTGASFC